MDEAWSVLATQLPLAVAFAIFAFILIKLFMDFIKEQRKEFLDALEKLSGEIGGKIDNLQKTVDSKRRL